MPRLRLTIWIRLRPWLIGVVFSAVGMFLGYDLGSELATLLGGEPGIWARLGKGLTWGGVIAALQWPVVRSGRMPFIRFVSTSALGFAVGYPLGQTIQGIVAWQWGMHWTGYAFALATFGFCLAVPQWWLLRRQVLRASLWLLFSVAGWLLWGAALSGPPVDVLASGVYGMPAGFGLVWLARFQRPDGAIKRPTESG